MKDDEGRAGKGKESERRDNLIDTAAADTEHYFPVLIAELLHVLLELVEPVAANLREGGGGLNLCKRAMDLCVEPGFRLEEDTSFGWSSSYRARSSGGAGGPDP